ncbi:MAG TPA: porin family protein [Sunxiuqinia sp.]|nr:porin family protein [Sunxiuqinia sp.]
MKKIGILFLFVIFIVPAMAESPINLGLKAGYNSSKLTTDLSNFNENGVNNFLAGAFLRVNLGRIYVQPEAYFNSKGGKLETTSGSPVQMVNEFDFNTVDVPVLLGVNVINNTAFKLRANAGPLMSFFTNKKLTSDYITSDQIKNNFFGWQYGLGADFLFFTLDARMENSTGNLYTGPQINNTDLNAKSKSFVVSLGIKIL